MVHKSKICPDFVNEKDYFISVNDEKANTDERQSISKAKKRLKDLPINDEVQYISTQFMTAP